MPITAHNEVGSPPDMVRWILRNAENADCAITALQLATGLTYESVLAAAIVAQPNVLTRGLFWREIKRVVKLLGYKSRKTKKFNLDEDTGVLGIRFSSKDEHVVYLWAGRVIDPGKQAMYLDADDYLNYEQASVTELLIVERAG